VDADPADPVGPASVAVLGGLSSAFGFLILAYPAGLRYSDGDLSATAASVGYAGHGLFLVAAVPLYTLGRFSLVSPSLVAAWSFANVFYLRWFAYHPHPISSYLTVWPLFLGLVVAAAGTEFGVRTGAERLAGRFGPRPLF
jgi:hypothetical protein